MPGTHCCVWEAVIGHNLTHLFKAGLLEILIKKYWFIYGTIEY